ncbi:hypothetical protein FRC04_001272 [Tulasnella sp. 424]|nr:hypothetical protein FRC04_001272 [Tulasnella sp. 424]
MNLKKKKKMGGQKKEKAKPAAAAAWTRKDEDEEGEEEDTVSDNEATPATSPAPTEPTLQSIFAMSDDPDQPLMPFQRYNAMLAVLRNTLYIYGGIYEYGPKEYTLDDFWSIQLDKMDTFTCLRPLDVTIDQNAESDSEGDDDGGDDDDDDDEDQSEGDGQAEDEPGVDAEVEAGASEALPAEPDPAEDNQVKLRAKANEFLGSSKDTTRSAEEQISTPLPGETLAMFYARSKDHWAQTAHANSDNKGKLLRRDGFALAEERYASYKPILEEVERILAEAGLDEEEIKRVGASGGQVATTSRNRR